MSSGWGALTWMLRADLPLRFYHFFRREQKEIAIVFQSQEMKDAYCHSIGSTTY